MAVIQETVVGLNYTIFLGISSDCAALMIKESFFNHYCTHYFFKSFPERVLIKDENWAWKNTIALDNSKVLKNVYSILNFLWTGRFL